MKYQHQFGKNNGQVEFEVADSGSGLPQDFTLDNNDSLGSMLIQAFAIQLQAETEITNGEKELFLSSPFR